MTASPGQLWSVVDVIAVGVPMMGIARFVLPSFFGLRGKAPGEMTGGRRQGLIFLGVTGLILVMRRRSARGGGQVPGP